MGSGDMVSFFSGFGSAFCTSVVMTLESLETTLVLELTSGEICLDDVMAGDAVECWMDNDCGSKDVITGPIAGCLTGYNGKNLAPAAV